MNLDAALQVALDERKAQSRYREPRTVEAFSQRQKIVGGKPLQSFSSNDYLGLSQDPRVIQAFQAGAQEFGAGSGASHLVDGHSRIHHQLEEAIAAYTGRERALVFSTGYMANLGAIGALLGPALKGKTSLFEDKLNHASLLDAAPLSGTKLQRYRHNDMAHLERLLAKSDAERKLVAVDGVFSMDGDIAPLPQLAKLAKRYGAWLMVDDAHGIGCLGDRGRGALFLSGLSQDDVPVLMGTCGKALGSFGAFIAGSAPLIEALIQFARTYIYTTALPPGVASATLESLRILQQEPEHQARLQSNVQYFRAKMNVLLTSFSSTPFKLLESFTAIQPLIIGEEALALELSKALEARGFWVGAIRPPTVPVGTSRLRITLSAAHTESDIDALVGSLSESMISVGLR